MHLKNKWTGIAFHKVLEAHDFGTIHCKVLTGSSWEKAHVPLEKENKNKIKHYFIHGGTEIASRQGSKYQPEDMDHISFISPLIR